MRIAVVPLIAAALVAGMPASASAQSLRCRNDLASVGDNKAVVASKCGEPAAKDAYCKVPTTGAYVSGTTLQPSIDTPCETVEEWTYRPGPGQLVTILKFESGRLRSIEYGSRIP